MKTNSRRLSLLALLCALVGHTPAAETATPRPKLQIINGSAQTVDVFWLKSATERVPSGTVAPGANTVITTMTGHRFAVVGRDNRAERIVTSEVLVQAMRFDPPDADGIPAFYAQRVSAGGFPIVASATVNAYAMKEAVYLVDLLLAQRPDVRAAMIKSGARLSVLAWNEFTCDQPEWEWLARLPVPGFADVAARAAWAAARRIRSARALRKTCSAIPAIPTRRRTL